LSRMGAALFFVVQLFVLPLALVHADPPSEKSILFTDSNELAYYKKSYTELAKRERWRVKIHGLRNVPLHPDVWEIKKLDRTDSRALVPIRPYYLRTSEDKDFRFRSISFRVRFNAVEDHAIIGNPWSYSPILDIGFGASFRLDPSRKKVREDHEYIARISAQPEVPPGFWFRSRLRSVKLKELGEPGINTARWYEVELQVAHARAELRIDGKKVAEIEGEALDAGLVSLSNDWHPIQMKDLRVRGVYLREDKEVPFEASGLVDVTK